MEKTSESKISSTLMKDINRIRKMASAQIKMNILRKHQIKLLNEFIQKLLEEGRITKQELKKYMPRKKEAEKIIQTAKQEVEVFLRQFHQKSENKFLLLLQL